MRNQMQLKCNECDCIHNKQENCNAHVIQVNESGAGKNGKDVFCNTYSKDVNIFVATASEHMGYPVIGDGLYTEEYAEDFSNEIPQVACTASKCSYNKSYECVASDIKILAPEGNGLKCECETFCPK